MVKYQKHIIIMRVQLFEKFILPENKVVTYTGLNEEQLKDAVTISFNQFSEFHEPNTHGMIRSALIQMTDADISTAVYVDGKIAGCLLLKNMNVNNTPFISDYPSELDDMNGVFGNAFVILPEYRNTRVISILIRELKKLNDRFEYIWFGQFDDYTDFIRYGNKSKHICDANFGYGTIHFYYSLL